MSNLIPILGWVTVGIVSGVLIAGAANRRCLISKGRGARAPVCTSCPFVSPEQRFEILTGRASEAPPPLPVPLTMFDGSGAHRPV